MLIDITMKITPQMIKDSPGKDNKALSGHVGTHFDAMNREFPLAYTQRSGIVFDVTDIRERDICSDDIDFEAVKPEMFVAFYSGFAEEIGYEGKTYFTDHPQLSHELIDALVKGGYPLSRWTLPVYGVEKSMFQRISTARIEGPLWWRICAG